MDAPSYPRVQQFLVRKTGKVLDIDLDALESAFEGWNPEGTVYLDLETGDMSRVDEEPGGRFLPINPEESRVASADLERFIPTVDDARLQERLRSVLIGTRPFRHFLDALEDYPRERERWSDFESTYRQQRVVAWLAEHGIEPVPEPTE
jgi:hypothetical protein